jgi:ABC-2 type transport system ATP-binding protein
MTKSLFAVQANCLTKRFNKFIAVDRLSLEIPVGKSVGLLGPNGAGKSTTLKMLVGAIRATSGSVHILGIDAAKEPSAIKQRVGYVPEASRFYPWMTVAETIQFVKPMFRETWDDSLAESLLDQFELNSKQKTKHLSLGMLSKLSLLIAVAHKPELLILDEPLTGFDPIAREDFINDIMRDTDDSSRTIIFSSHQLDDVSRLVDSIAILDKGKLLAYRTIDEVVRSVQRVRAVCSAGAKPCRLPENIIRLQVLGQECSFTVDQLDEHTSNWIQQSYNCKITEVQELSLGEIFRDFVLGERDKSCWEHYSKRTSE